MTEHAYTVEQEYGQVESNALMLSEDVARHMVQALNQDLASLYVLHHQYHKHQWVVEGPQFRELEQLFSMHAEAVEQAAVELGERINALGAVPAATMRRQLQESYLEEEPDGVLELRAMLRRDVEAERTIANKLREHIKLAQDLGDYGTEDLLKQTLENTEKRAAFVQKHLERESLARDMLGTQPHKEPVTPTVAPATQ
ncbi:ferritin-like domain-containing protein [Kallotenue papyrolyticum]|uniref:ferritin-like domain-containing protein n=1 Tax=Kallotenue papyrolyticum TaxID=1325125 RepID=UPI00047853DA|nr:DNA starvation/stationary phase protection protein [Kallotenue papyrolyticum]